MSAATRVLLAVTLGVVAALLVFSATVYGDLPARIPTHFNAAGIPDAFGPRTSWWFLPLIGVTSTGLALGVSLAIPGRPHLLNVPRKDEILALPLAAQHAVIRQAQPGLMLLGLTSALLPLWIQYATWQVTQRRMSGLGNVIIVVPIVAIALLPAILLPVYRELRRQQAALARP